MSLEYFQLQIESEREWREEELRVLDNTQRAMIDENARKKIRRSMLCLVVGSRKIPYISPKKLRV